MTTPNTAEAAILVSRLRAEADYLDGNPDFKGPLSVITACRDAADMLSASPAPASGVDAVAGIYIASKTTHGARWRDLRASGVPIISTWIDEAEAGATSNWPDLWHRCVREASRAAATIVYREPGEVLKGAFVEMGAALSSGRTVFAVGCEEFSVRHHMRVVPCSSLEEALELAHEHIASLSPAATPVSEAEPVAFPADGELLNMEDGERANAFWRWSKAAGLPLHMAESGLNRFHADDRAEWAWQAWCAALAKPASSPADVREAARIIYEAYQSAVELPPAIRDVAARGGFFSALRLLIDPDADLRQPYNPLSPSTSAARGGAGDLFHFIEDQARHSRYGVTIEWVVGAEGEGYGFSFGRQRYVGPPLKTAKEAVERALVDLGSGRKLADATPKAHPRPAKENEGHG